MNIFEPQTVSTETWSAQGAVFTWTVSGSSQPQNETDAGKPTSNQPRTANAVPMIMNSIEITCEQPNTVIYPINVTGPSTLQRIVFKGPLRGIMRIGSIFSPSSTTLMKFLEAVGKDCKEPKDQVTMTLRPFGGYPCAKSSSAGARYNFSQPTQVPDLPKITLNCVELTQIGINIDSGRSEGITIVNMPLSFIFTGAKWFMQP